jgi:hypothetical protein
LESYFAGHDEATKIWQSKSEVNIMVHVDWKDAAPFHSGCYAVEVIIMSFYFCLGLHDDDADILPEPLRTDQTSQTPKYWCLRQRG